MNDILRHATDEEYRRIAELYLELDKELLKKHIYRALRHNDIDVREVGQDFQKHVGFIPKIRHEYRTATYAKRVGSLVHVEI